LDDATYPNFDTWVADAANLADYRTIFINCGNGYEWTFFDDTDAVANLRSWVEGGGRLYATDLSYDFIEQLFPEYIDFYGDDEADGLGTTPEEQGAAEWGDHTEEVSCTILDADLLAWLQGLGLLSGTDQAVIHGWLSAWAGVDAVANGVKVWVEGPAPIDGSTDVRPVTMTFSVGDGTVFFSSYHTEEEFGTDIYPQERILQYMILEVL
jgi:hypothetical protein